MSDENTKTLVGTVEGVAVEKETVEKGELPTVNALKPEPNIIFTRKVERKNAKGEMKTVDAEPPKAIHTVGLTIKLPSAAEQLKGFYHEDAARIIRESSDYKEFKPKGK